MPEIVGGLAVVIGVAVLMWAVGLGRGRDDVG